jgi:hypothetical protein
MGLIPADQVPDIHILTSPNLSDPNRITAASVKTVTVDQVVGVEGARSPSAATSPKAFNVAYIVTDDRPYSDAAYAYFSILSRGLMALDAPTQQSRYARFHWATGGRATLDTRLPAPAADADGDSMNDEWERRCGLHPHASAKDGPSGDADGDGVSNLAESAAGTHARAITPATSPRARRAAASSSGHASRS